MTSVAVGIIAFLIYAYALGATSVMVWRNYNGKERWIPATLTGLYYITSTLFPTPAVMSALNGTEFLWTDAFRSILSSVALATGLYYLSKTSNYRRSKIQ